MNITMPELTSLSHFSFEDSPYYTLTKAVVVLISQKQGRCRLDSYKNSPYQREYERDHGIDMEFNINFINEGDEKANANLMELYFYISMFEKEILTGLICFKTTKSKDLWMHIWPHYQFCKTTW